MDILHIRQMATSTKGTKTGVFTLVGQTDPRMDLLNPSKRMDPETLCEDESVSSYLAGVRRGSDRR